MQTVGVTTVFLFLATFAAVFWGFLNPAKFQMAAGLGAFFFALACVLLAITIWKRTKTERI